MPLCEHCFLIKLFSVFFFDFSFKPPYTLFLYGIDIGFHESIVAYSYSILYPTRNPNRIFLHLFFSPFKRISIAFAFFPYWCQKV